MKFNFLHFLKIIAIEIAYFYLIAIGYGIFSMLMFGEGESSFMYSNANGVIYVCLMFIPQTLFNAYKTKKYWSSCRPKSVNYLLAEFIIVILTAYFAIKIY